MRPLIIATRKSPLALWQAHHVAGLLREAHGREATLLELTTEGDRFLQAPLSQIGGKGLFVKEIEQALLDHRADLAVHSLKDMTSAMPDGLLLGCIPVREDPRDAFVGRKADSISALRPGARVGTSSLRRTCQLKARRPDLEIVPLRGNVQTRLRRAEEQDLDGAVLAYAGLRRLGLAEVATELLPIADSLPAVGQGALAVQCRKDDAEVRTLLAKLNDPGTALEVSAERAFLALLEGGCNVPLAGYAERDAGRLRLRGLIGAIDGSKILRDEVEGPEADAVTLGETLAERMLAKGGAELLKANAKPSKVPNS